jgi:hypothetical protein
MDTLLVMGPEVLDPLAPRGKVGIQTGKPGQKGLAAGDMVGD